MMKMAESSLIADDPNSVREEFTKAIPLGRYAEAEEIANLVLFLGSDDAAFITGAPISIDGGMLA